MYSTIRILFFSVIAAGLVGLIRLMFGSVKKKHLIWVITICILLCSVAHLIPIENCWIEFNTPEEALRYICSDQIIDTAYANQSCMVFYSSGVNTYSHVFLRIEDAKYKITNLYSEKLISESLTSDGYFEVLQVRGTSDYYLLGTTNASLDSIALFDAYGNHVDVSLHSIPDTSFIFGGFSDFDEGYYITIDNASKVVFEIT